MILGPVRFPAPWSFWAGALLVAGAFVLPGPLAGQIPPDSAAVPDSLLADSLAVDSLAALQLLDSLQVADSLRLDSLHIDNFPSPRRRAPRGFHTGAWEWDREELLWTSAFTLADLLATVPGIMTLKSGDYGMPLTVTAFGAAAGRVRVVTDGIERIPYEGGALDLTQISLAGVEHVSVRRSAAGILVELETLRFDDARAYSQIDVGTGDLETNLFRGTFGLPRAAGGSAVAALERVDTRGPGGKERGALSEAWIRFGIVRGDRGGIEFDYRRRSQERGELFAPANLVRREWSVRTRARIGEGLYVGGHYARTGLEGEGLTGDTVSAEDVRELTASLWADRGPFWATASVRSFSGAGLPGSVQEASAGLDEARLGGLAATVRREAWDGVSLTRTSLRGWTSPVYGAFLFAELDQGKSGVPHVPYFRPLQILADSVYVPYARPLQVDDRTTRRLGVGFAWRDVLLEGARVTVEADSIFPLGLPIDRGPAGFPGGRREGYEANASLPIPLLDGLFLKGNVVRWSGDFVPPPDSLGQPVAGLADDAWPYLPRLFYDAKVHFRRSFLPTGNFELLVNVGVQEREAMRVFRRVDTVSVVAPPSEGEEAVGPVLPPTDVVRFHQNWYARLEMRIVTLKIFVEWENASVRRDRQDFPGRILPATRAVYGVRWTLRN